MVRQLSIVTLSTLLAAFGVATTLGLSSAASIAEPVRLVCGDENIVLTIDVDARSVLSGKGTVHQGSTWDYTGTITEVTDTDINWRDDDPEHRTENVFAFDLNRVTGKLTRHMFNPVCHYRYCPPVPDGWSINCKKARPVM